MLLLFAPDVLIPPLPALCGPSLDFTVIDAILNRSTLGTPHPTATTPLDKTPTFPSGDGSTAPPLPELTVPISAIASPISL